MLGAAVAQGVERVAVDAFRAEEVPEIPATLVTPRVGDSD